MTDETETTTRETWPLDSDTLTAPVYEGHKRGNNWGAILRGPNAARAVKAWLPKRHVGGELFYLTDDVKVGDALEFGADYRSGGGNLHPCRRHYVVVAKRESEIEVERHPSAAKAIKAARTLVPETAAVA